jgi:DNA-directed RNA polymerase specialized sigma24 family protein
MQPPTEPITRTASGIPGRPHGDEADLYRRHHHRLLRAVSHAVNASPDVIEDACQTAWAALLRCTVDPGTVFAWLRVVAIHEAHKHCARTRNETPAGAFRTPYTTELEPGEHPEPTADTRDVADQVAERIHRAQQLHDLATIKPHDRQALYLKGLGYRYREIMQITSASYTAVNRRLTEGRRALRKLERDRENTAPSKETPASATSDQERRTAPPRELTTTARRPQAGAPAFGQGCGRPSRSGQALARDDHQLRRTSLL